MIRYLPTLIGLGTPLGAPIPRVEDKVGLVVQEHFERFLET